MIARIAKALACASILMLSAMTPAMAGGGCTAAPISGEELARRAEWAVRIYHELDRSNPELALIARVGSDVSQYRLRYTHIGFVWRDHPKGRWGLVHMLNTCGRDIGHIYDQGLLNFLLDDPFALDILILELDTRLQKAIVARIEAGYALRFYHSAYSTVANPFSTKYQNSNQWLLEILAAAQGDLVGMSITKRHEAQALYQRLGYRGTVIHLSPFKQMLAKMTRSNIFFDDHPEAAQHRGEFETNTVKAIWRYVERNGLVTRKTELIYPHPELFERRPPSTSDGGTPKRNLHAER